MDNMEIRLGMKYRHTSVGRDFLLYFNLQAEHGDKIHKVLKIGIVPGLILMIKVFLVG